MPQQYRKQPCSLSQATALQAAMLWADCYCAASKPSVPFNKVKRKQVRLLLSPSSKRTLHGYLTQHSLY
jgi:hypothetical protein